MSFDDVPGTPATSMSAPLSRRALLGWGSLAGAGLTFAAAGAAQATQPGLPAGSIPGKATTLQAAGTAGPGLTPFPQQQDLNFSTLGLYGESAYGASEVGEVATTVALVQADITAGGARSLPAYQSYVTRFEALAARLAQQAATDQAAGRRSTARGEYLRASAYYAGALFYVLGTATPQREPDLYGMVQAQWAAAAALLSPQFERVDVPASVRFPAAPGASETVTRRLTLPAYFAAAPGPGHKPTVIVCNGSDAQLIDTYVYGGAAALDRGFNVLLFEGPGQGSLLFEQNVPFTPYWQDVISPLVDYVLSRSEVDPKRVGLSGWSFGGLLALRAAAYEPRLAAVVSDPAFADNSASWQQLITGLQAFGGVNDAALSKLLAATPEYGVPDGRLAVSFLLRKRGEIYIPAFHDQALQGAPITGIADVLAAVAAFNADDALLGRIRSRLLLNSYELDEFYAPAQADAVRASVRNATSASQNLFTEAQGAEYHCAPLAPVTRNDVVFDWFDSAFAGGVAAPAPTTSVSSVAALGVVGGAAVVVGAAAAADAARRRRSPAEAETHQDGRPAGPSLPGPRHGNGVSGPERSTADAGGSPADPTSRRL